MERVCPHTQRTDLEHRPKNSTRRGAKIFGRIHTTKKVPNKKLTRKLVDDDIHVAHTCGCARPIVGLHDIHTLLVELTAGLNGWAARHRSAKVHRYHFRCSVFENPADQSLRCSSSGTSVSRSIRIAMP